MVKVQEVRVICGASFLQSPGTLQTKGKGSVGTANVLVAGSIPLHVDNNNSTLCCLFTNSDKIFYTLHDVHDSLHAHESSSLQYSHNSHFWLGLTDRHSHAKVTFAFIMDFCLFHYFIGKPGLLSSLCRYIG